MALAVQQRDLVNVPLVKAHILASVVSFLTILVAGLLYSLQFLQAYPFPGVELLSPGRVRLIHTNLTAYGFIANAFIAAILWAVPRLTRRPILNDKFGWLIFYAWQAILLATGIGLLGGEAQALEWGETPVWIDPVVMVGLVLLVVNVGYPIVTTKEPSLYVSLWYFSAAFAWTGLVYFMGNYFPEFWTPGATGAAITGLFIHDLVGLFVTPIGWGMMYYFVPILLKKPIWSHALSLIGFWGLAFFYPLQGVHHFLLSPIPMYAQYGAVVSTVAIEIVVTTVIVNFFATIRGSGDMLRTNMPIRWFYTGMVCYFTTCLQCAFQVTLTFQEIIHFTDWVVGHAHLVMFGVFGFWILGFFVELWPRIVGKPWKSKHALEWHYWLTVIGLGLMFIDLTAVGVVQGFSWRALNPWIDSVIDSVPFWYLRTITGVMIVAGQLILFYQMWATAKQTFAGSASAATVAAD